MVINNNSKNAEGKFDAELDIKKVANIFYRAVFNKSSLTYKYDHLQVNVEDGDLVAAHLQSFRDIGSPDHYVIEIQIPKWETELTFEKVVAHELSHLNFTELNVLSDFCPTDQTYASTAVLRYNADGKYGYWVEEQLCNYFSYKAIAVLHHFSFEEAREKCPYKAYAEKFMDEFIIFLRLFSGKRPSDFDNYLYDTGNVFLKEVFDSHNLSNFICEYDKLCGRDGAWKELNLLIEQYHKTTDPAILEQIKGVFGSFSSEITKDRKSFRIYRKSYSDNWDWETDEPDTVIQPDVGHDYFAI